ISANATSGASSGGVGLAGAFALSIATIGTDATSSSASAGGGAASITAHSASTVGADAHAATTSSGAVGIGASVALDIVNITTTADVGSGVGGANGLTVNAAATNTTTTNAKTGASAGSFSIAPAVA